MKTLDEVAEIMDQNQPIYFIRYRMDWHDWDASGSRTFIQDIVNDIKKAKKNDESGEPEIYSVIKGVDVTAEFTKD